MQAVKKFQGAGQFAAGIIFPFPGIGGKDRGIGTQTIIGWEGDIIMHVQRVGGQFRNKKITAEILKGPAVPSGKKENSAGEKDKGESGAQSNRAFIGIGIRKGKTGKFYFFQ